MLNSDIVDQQLLEQFLEALNALPDAQAKLRIRLRSAGPDQRYDARVDCWVGGKAASLLIGVKKTLFPRDARQALWEFRELESRWPQSLEGRQTVSFLVAHSISPGARDLLRHERVGYYDSGGSLFLPAENIYVYVDKPAPKALSKSIRSLYSGRRAQVLHALLMRHREWFGVKETAEQARVSPATASQVLSELERFDWVVSRGKGPAKERQLRQPGALLDAWAKQLAVIRPLAMRRYFVPSVPADGLVKRFAEVCAANQAEYAITHEAAGQRYAPRLSTVSQLRCRLVVGASADGVLDALDAHIVDQGANLTVIDVKSPGTLLFREFVDEIWLASPVQVYLDLLSGEGRAKELAGHLRDEKIGF